MLILLVFLGIGSLASCNSTRDNVETLFEDGFGKLKSGLYSSPVGAHTEYHYLAESAPQGDWEVSTFRSYESQRAWRVISDDGVNVMQQAMTDKKGIHYHPMIVAGDPLWENYSVTVEFKPDSNEDQSGLAFRYRNDRCYYFFGVDGSRAILKMVRHATAYHKPYEKILAKADFKWTGGEYLVAKVDVNGSHIRAQLNNGVVLEADDSTFAMGRICLTSDVGAFYKRVTVTASSKEMKELNKRIKKREDELNKLQAANPVSSQREFSSSLRADSRPWISSGPCSGCRSARPTRPAICSFSRGLYFIVQLPSGYIPRSM